MLAIVDDDRSVRESLQGLLESMGYAVETFASASSFLAAGAAARFRCVVLDVQMPGMTGPELQRTLKTTAPALPIVFVTSNADEDLRTRLVGAGAVACLFKPFSEEDLVAALGTALGN